MTEAMKEPFLQRKSGKLTSFAAVAAIVLSTAGCPTQGGVGDGPGPGRGGADGFGSEQLGTESSLLQFEEGGSVVAGGPLEDIPFEFDSERMSPAAMAAMERNAGWFSENPGVRVEIEGHCDERGTSEYNLALGARRARVVRDALVEYGVSSDQLSTVSYGEELPLCKEPVEPCWVRNRRAHLVPLGR